MTTNNKKLDAARARVASLQRDIADLEASGPSRSEIRTAIAAYLTTVEADGHRTLARRVIDPAERAHAGGLLAPMGAKADMAPLLLALLGSGAVLAALDRHVAALPEGLDHPARAARLQALRAALWDAEVAEEAALVACEENGLDVQRRADADPAAVLFLAA